MAPTASNIMGNWPIVAASVTGLGLIVAIVRYRIPDLAKKVEAIESNSSQHPTKEDLKKDLETVVESFRTICQFNQVTCQKGVNCQINQVREDLDKKLSVIFKLINDQAIIIARVDERMAAMHEHHLQASQTKKRVVNDE